MRFRSILQLLVCGLLLILPTGCRNNEPIRLGFVGGLSGRVADLGVAGRNGVQLAVEQCNSAGGIAGRQVELVVRDDEQNPETAKRVVGELIGQRIELIIGPMTSSVAMAVMPQINASQTILLSPTVTTVELGGQDDNFLRVISATTDYASQSARYLYQKLGSRRVAAIYDSGNRSYSEGWLNGFRTVFTAQGGKLVLTKAFQSGRDTLFQPVAQELLASQADTVLIVSGAVDSALICQQIRTLDPGRRIAMSEWAATERFIELAGKASEGVVEAQFMDRNDTSPRYRDFLAAYRARFNQDPGFAGMAGYDAALVALEAYTIRKNGETLKSVILAKGVFQGVQQTLSFDRSGDANRKTFMAVILNGQYVTVN